MAAIPPTEGGLVTEKAINRLLWSRPYLLSFLGFYFLYLPQKPRHDGQCTWNCHRQHLYYPKGTSYATDILVWKCLSRLWLRAGYGSWCDACLLSSCHYVWLLRKIGWCLGCFDIHRWFYMWGKSLFCHFSHIRSLKFVLQIILGIHKSLSVTKQSIMSYMRDVPASRPIFTAQDSVFPHSPLSRLGNLCHKKN